MDLTLAIILIGLLGGLSLFLAIRLYSLDAKNKTIISDLTAANEREENGLLLCYMLQTVLEMYIILLREEQQRFAHLQKAYDDFADRVAEATQQRRVRRGLTAILSLIPGANLIGVLGDVLDVFGETIEVEDVVGDVADLPNLKDLEIEDDPTQLFVSSVVAKKLLDVSGEQHVLKDPKALDQSTLKNLVDDTIKRVAEWIGPITVPQRKKIAANFTARLEGLLNISISYEHSEETGTLPQTRNPSGSEQKE